MDLQWKFLDEKSWPPLTGLEPLFAGRNLRKYARALDQSATRRPLYLCRIFDQNSPNSKQIAFVFTFYTHKFHTCQRQFFFKKKMSIHFLFFLSVYCIVQQQPNMCNNRRQAPKCCLFLRIRWEQNLFLYYKTLDRFQDGIQNTHIFHVLNKTL